MKKLLGLALPSPALGACFALLLTARPVTAQRTLTIDRFDSKVAVQVDGGIDVTETITATFAGKWNGIYRKVPLDYRTPSGFNWSIHIDFLGATDGNGEPLRTDLSREGPYIKLKMWVPGAEDATRTIVLHYHATNALRFFDDHDELYWNATGDQWDVALGEVTAQVTLPDGAEGIRSTAFNGSYGSTSKEALIQTAGRVVSFSMPRKLDFQEGLTVVVGWNKGLVRAPTALDRVKMFLANNWPVGIPIPVFFLMLFLWWTRGRDPARRSVMAQYEPPTGMTPAEAGTITDESVDMRDITATLVDLAVRKYLKIEEREKPKVLGMFGGGPEYWFHRSQPSSAWATLQVHEQRVLEGIFEGSGDVVALSDLQNEFYTSLDGIKSGVMNRLVSQGHYRSRPDRVRAGWMAGGVFAGVVIGMLGSALGEHAGFTPAPFIVAGILTGLIIVGFGYNMPARTVLGTRTLEHVLGFQDFLTRVDSDRFARVIKTPEMFEKFLPFAMAFGVDRQWSKAFEGIFTQSPSWYVGPNTGMFNPVYFSHSISNMTAQAASTMSSQPRSSGGSGFGGGGSSGGGGGGGGGGGF